MRSPARRALKARGPGDGGAAPPRVLARFLPCLPPAGRTLPWPVRMVLDASSTTLTQPLCACLRALPGSIARALWLQARRGTFLGSLNAQSVPEWDSRIGCKSRRAARRRMGAAAGSAGHRSTSTQQSRCGSSRTLTAHRVPR